MTKHPVLLSAIALDLVALVGLTFAFPHHMVGPGRLLEGHAELATDCFACHAAWRGASSSRCTGCHAVAEVGLKTTKGVPIAGGTIKRSFHQELVELDCMACHGDHQGSRPTRRSRKAFSHGLLKAAARERCASCHAAPADAMHREREAGCGQCHQVSAWKPATFDHDRHFVLDRDHQASCDTCHPDADYGRYSCYGCHEHSPAKVRKEHVEEGIRDFERCVACHRDPRVEPEKGGERERGHRERERDHQGRERGHRERD